MTTDNCDRYRISEDLFFNLPEAPILSPHPQETEDEVVLMQKIEEQNNPSVGLSVDLLAQTQIAAVKNTSFHTPRNNGS